jgi:hypothetical protein
MSDDDASENHEGFRWHLPPQHWQLDLIRLSTSKEVYRVSGLRNEFFFNLVTVLEIIDDSGLFEDLVLFRRRLPDELCLSHLHFEET